MKKALGFFAALISSQAFGSPLPPQDLPDLVEKTLPSVVNVSSTTIIDYRQNGMEGFLDFWGLPRERKQTSLGSGFIIDKDGFMLTNNHVVEKASEVIVTLLDKRQFRAKIIGHDAKMDVALLQIRDKENHVPTELKPVAIGNSDAVRIGESAFAVGNPFGLQHTVTLGIISAKNRTIGQGPFDNFLQTDASINPGNSGGPLFNLKGEVVGINTVIFSRTGTSGGLGFAIPVNEAKALVPDLKRYGRVPRPWLGILVEPITPALAHYHRLSTDKGIFIGNLVEDGPADQSEIHPGDVILSIDGTMVAEPNDLERAILRHKPNDSADLKVLRGRASLDIKVKMEELPRRDDIPQGIM